MMLREHMVFFLKKKILWALSWSMKTQRSRKRGKTLCLKEKEQKISSFKTFDNAVVGFIGAGNYASRMLIPAFKKAGARLHTVSQAGERMHQFMVERMVFEYATSDTDELLANSEINAVAIVTRHNSHAKFVIQALEAGKQRFRGETFSVNS